MNSLDRRVQEFDCTNSFRAVVERVPLQRSSFLPSDDTLSVSFMRRLVEFLTGLEGSCGWWCFVMVVEMAIGFRRFLSIDLVSAALDTPPGPWLPHTFAAETRVFRRALARLEPDSETNRSDSETRVLKLGF